MENTCKAGGFVPGSLFGGLAGQLLTRMVQQRHKYLNVNPSPLSIIQQGETLANGCYKQTIKVPDAHDVRKFIGIEQLICPQSKAALANVIHYTPEISQQQEPQSVVHVVPVQQVPQSTSEPFTYHNNEVPQPTSNPFRETVGASTLPSSKLHITQQQQQTQKVPQPTSDPFYEKVDASTTPNDINHTPQQEQQRQSVEHNLPTPQILQPTSDPFQVRLRTTASPNIINFIPGIQQPQTTSESSQGYVSPKETKHYASDATSLLITNCVVMIFMIAFGYIL